MGTKRLDWIHDYGRAGYCLRVFCMLCGYVAVLDPTDVRERSRTRQAPFIQATEQRMKCGQCGARKAACSPANRD